MEGGYGETLGVSYDDRENIHRVGRIHHLGFRLTAIGPIELDREADEKW